MWIHCRENSAAKVYIYTNVSQIFQHLHDLKKKVQLFTQTEANKQKQTTNKKAQEPDINKEND